MVLGSGSDHWRESRQLGNGRRHGGVGNGLVAVGAAKRTAGRMNLFDLFPNLTSENHEITSDKTFKYNCVAWAAHQTDRWWQPGGCWPIPASRDDLGIGNVVLAFNSLGYCESPNGELEHGFEKIAIYGSGLMYTHVARQLPDGRWTSKLGQLEDITHATTYALEGSDYGEVVQFMK